MSQLRAEEILPREFSNMSVERVYIFHAGRRKTGEVRPSPGNIMG